MVGGRAGQAEREIGPARAGAGDRAGGEHEHERKRGCATCQPAHAHLPRLRVPRHLALQLVSLVSASVVRRVEPPSERRCSARTVTPIINALYPTRVRAPGSYGYGAAPRRHSTATADASPAAQRHSADSASSFASRSPTAKSAQRTAYLSSRSRQPRPTAGLAS